MKAVKTIAALALFGGFALVLVQPVIDSEGGGAAAPVVGATPEPGDEASPAASGDGPEEALDAALPDECLEKQRRADFPLVAAHHGGRIRIGPADQPPLATVRGETPVAWSPSGTFLGEGGGEVFTAGGRSLGALFDDPLTWEWSPAADCAIAVTESGLSYSVVNGATDQPLWEAPVNDVEFSPNGRRLAVALEPPAEGLWIANLGTGKVARVTENPAAIAGWFSNRAVLYSKNADSARLRFAAGARETRVVKRATFLGRSVRHCRGRTFLVGAETHVTPALTELVSVRGRIRGEGLAAPDPGFGGYQSIACSPDGELVLATTTTGGDSAEPGPLVVLRPDGTFVGELLSGPAVDVRWGRSGEGALLARLNENGRGRLWLVPPGEGPTRTSYTVGGPGHYDWSIR